MEDTSSSEGIDPGHHEDVLPNEWDAIQGEEWWGGNPLDRSHGDKKSIQFEGEAKQNAVYLLVSKSGVLTTSQEAVGLPPNYARGKCEETLRLCWLSETDLPEDVNEKCLLGYIQPENRLSPSGPHWYWSVNVDEASFKTPTGAEWKTGRAILTGGSSREDVALAGQALAICGWHRGNRFSCSTGVPSTPIELGAKREATQGRSRFYPRTDPVAIVAVLSPDSEHILLGRSARFQKENRTGFFTCLAGFIEQAMPETNPSTGPYFTLDYNTNFCLTGGGG